MPLSRRPSSPASASPLRGFTLVELLTVIAIIGILAAILIPLVGRIRQSARTTQDMANMRTFGQTLMQYAADNKGRINQHANYSGDEGWPLNTFMGRAWPYLQTNNLTSNLSKQEMEEVSEAYISQVLLHERDDLIAAPGGQRNTLAFNKGLQKNSTAANKNPVNSNENFYRLAEIARPSSTIYATVGTWGFNTSGTTIYRPEPLPETLPAERIYWPYSNQRTILIYLDGHTAFWGAPIPPAMYRIN